MCGASKIIGVDLNPDKEKFGKLISLPVLIACRAKDRDIFFLY